MSAQGLGNNSPRTYFKVKNGYIVITIKADQEERNLDLIQNCQTYNALKNEKGVDIIDICYGHFEGYVRNIEAFENDYGKSWNVTFETQSGDVFVWSVIYDSLLFQSFINCLASIDDNNIGSIKLQPWKGIDNKGKEQTKLSIQHNGNKLNWKFLPEELPPITTAKDEDGNDLTDAKGNLIYNKKKRMNWLIGEVDKIVTKIKAFQPVKQAAQEVEADEQPY